METAQIHIDFTTYAETVSRPGVVVVKFGKDDCPPCERYDSWIGELIGHFRERALFCCVNLSEAANRGSAETLEWKRGLDLTSVPHVIIYQDGEIRESYAPANSTTSLRMKIDRIVSGAGPESGPM